MSGFSKKLKIRIVTMVIVAMCVMNFSPMTAYASEPDAFEAATMVVDGVEREAIRYNGEGPFVLELVVAGFVGELANTRFNVFFGRDGFGSITATGAAVSWMGPANLCGDYYKIDNMGTENAGLFEVAPREEAGALTVAFAPSNPQSLISVNWHSSGRNKLTVMLRPGDATSRDYSVLRDFVYASTDGGLGTAGDFSIFANELDVSVDFEGNVAARRARLGGNGQFGVTNSVEDRAYTGTYIEQLVGDDWSRIVKKETGSLVLGRDDAGNRIYVTKDQGGEWMLWNEDMLPKKIAARDDLTNVFHVDDLTSRAGSKLIRFDEAFLALQNLANALSSAQTLGLDVSGGYTVLGEKGRESLYAGSVSEIRVEEGNGKDQITILCKSGRNNVVSLPAALLDNDRSFISFVGEDGAKDYSVIVNVTGLDGGNFSFQNPFIYLDGVQINGGYSRDAGRILWNLGTYSGEVGLGKTYAGIVLAPCASVIVLETHNGSVLANRIDVRNGEIHKNTFDWIPEPKITPTPTPLATPTPEDTSTPMPTGTPTPMPTPWTTDTPEPTPPSEETPTPEPTDTVIPTPPGEETPTPEPTDTVIPTPPGEETPTPEPTDTVIPTPPGEETPTPEPTNTVMPTPPGEETPTPEPTNTVTPTPPSEETPTPEPTNTVTPTPPGEETPTPEPTNTVTPTPPGGETPTPEPTNTVTPTPPGETIPTPGPTSTVIPTPPGGTTPTPEPTSTVSPTPPGETTPTPSDTPSVTPPAQNTPTPVPTPYNTIPTPTPVPTPTNTPTPTPTPETTSTPTPTVPLRSVEPSVSPSPSDSATSTPEATSTPNPSDENSTPTPDAPMPSPTPEEIIELFDDEPPLGIPDDPSNPDEEITVFDPEELLDILDDIPLGIPQAEPEKDPEEIEIEDETPEGLPQTGVAGTGLFVAIGMAMMSFGAALGIGGRKKKDKENKEK